MNRHNIYRNILLNVKRKINNNNKLILQNLKEKHLNKDDINKLILQNLKEKEKNLIREASIYTINYISNIFIATTITFAGINIYYNNY